MVPNISGSGKEDDTSADGDIRLQKEDLIASLSKRPDLISSSPPSVFTL